MNATIRKLLSAAVVLLADVAPCQGTPLYHLTDLGVLPGDTVSAGLALNASGQVTGYGYYLKTTTTPIYSAFLYSGGVIQSIGSSSSGAYITGNSINDSGQIVGESNSGAFLYSGGTLQNMNSLPGIAGSGWTLNSAAGINNGGQIVGTAINSAGTAQAFLYSAETLLELPVLPNQTSSVAVAVNASGQVAGNWGDSRFGPMQAFSYNNGSTLDLGNLPGQTTTLAYAINDMGQIVGESGPYPFLYSAAGMQNLGLFPNSMYSRALGINDSGEMVGDSNLGALLFLNGAEYNLTNLLDASGTGWFLTSATAVNNNGVILAIGTDPATDSSHAVLLTPVPEPTTCLLAAVGAAGVGCWRFRRRRAALGRRPFA